MKNEFAHLKRAEILQIMNWLKQIPDWQVYQVIYLTSKQHNNINKIKDNSTQLEGYQYQFAIIVQKLCKFCTIFAQLLHVFAQPII